MREALDGRIAYTSCDYPVDLESHHIQKLWVEYAYVGFLGEQKASQDILDETWRYL